MPEPKATFTQYRQAHLDCPCGHAHAEAFCVIRSVWETSKLNGLNPFDTLRLAFGGW